MIERQPDSVSDGKYDLLILGGGIYGATLALEAALRGMRPLVLERQDFGGATSWNSLRIVHGGLRYLQSLDLRRHRESVAERRWFLRHFPDLVRPLPCLMPLYNRGIRRPAVFRCALLLNDWLSMDGNDGVREDRRLPPGRVLTAEETISLYPGVDRSGLCGGAQWYDAAMPSSQRLVMEILRWAIRAGATCLNYVEARGLLVKGDRVAGVTAVDLAGNQMLEFRAPVVVNCTGPWSREISRWSGREVPELFHASQAFNLFVDRKPLSPMALAVTAKDPGARTYFLHPWEGRILAGTYHAPWSGPADDPRPDAERIARFCEELNQAAPELELTPSDVLRVHAGLLPARRPGSIELASREVLYDHGAHGGPSGMFSVSGVKFTTARRVAERTLGMIHTRQGRPMPEAQEIDRPPPRACMRLDALELLFQTVPATAAAYIRHLAKEEAVVHLDDLFMRRTDWGVDPGPALRVATLVSRAFGWDRARNAWEEDRLRQCLERRG